MWWSHCPALALGSLVPCYPPSSQIILYKPLPPPFISTHKCECCWGSIPKLPTLCCSGYPVLSLYQEFSPGECLKIPMLGPRMGYLSWGGVFSAKRKLWEAPCFKKVIKTLRWCQQRIQPSMWPFCTTWPCVTAQVTHLWYSPILGTPPTTNYISVYIQ